MRRLFLTIIFAFAACLSLYAQESSKYEEMLRSLDLSYRLSSVIPNYAFTANQIREALPEIENNEGRLSAKYAIWAYRLAEFSYYDKRYSEVIPIIEGLIEENLISHLQDDDLHRMYEIYISSLVRIEEFSKAEFLSSEFLQQARKTNDKKYLVEAIISRYRVRSLDSNAEFDELWSLLQEGYLNTDVNDYSYTSYEFLDEMLYMSVEDDRPDKTNYVLEQLDGLGKSTTDINTICAIQALLYDYYIEDYIANIDHINDIIRTAENKYYEYCKNLDKKSKEQNTSFYEQIQVQAFKLLLYLWDDYSEKIGSLGYDKTAVEVSDKIIKALTQEENGLSSTTAERMAHVGDVLDEKYLAKAYLRKGLHKIVLANNEWKKALAREGGPNSADTLKMVSAADSLNYNYDLAFSSLEFDVDFMIENRLKTMNDIDREYAIKNYRTVLNTALYGASLYPEDKYIRSAFNLLMFFKNLLLYFEKGDQSHPQTIDDIILQPREAVIEFGYSEYHREYYAFIVSNPSHDLAVECIPEKWLQKSLEGEMIYRNREFCNSLMQYLEPHISDCDVVYYSPTGLFSSINLDAVCRQSPYKHSFMLISSSRQLCQKVEENEHKTAALFGGLTYGTGKEVPIDSTRAGWSSLPYSLEEINGILSTMEKSKCSATVFTGQNGTEDVVKGFSSNSPSIIHFATHGFFMADGDTNPYFDDRIMIRTMNRSGLIMSNGQSAWLGNPVPEGKEDGVLLAGEIAMMDLSNTDIVSLSACNTGQGVISSEGVFGLQRALKKAGVQTIIMSLWKLNDRVAMEFMDCFYKNLFEGKTKRQSFNAARDLIYSNYRGDPFYWAPFIMMDGIESLGRNTEDIDSHIPSNQGYVNGHKWVDLGLSVKWAACNLGALRPENSGDLFAWGETSPKDTYRQDNYQHHSYDNQTTTILKYNTSSTYGNVDNISVLTPQDDAATVNWGENWRMPTEKEMNELVSNCIHQWSVINGQPGYLFISMINGNSIFLPASGAKYYSSYLGRNEYGWYTTSSLVKDNPVRNYELQFRFPDKDGNTKHVDIGGSERQFGCTIRPVLCR